MTEKNLQTILGANLRRYRNLLKFSQVKFAKKVAISVPFLSDIENGKKWASPNTLMKMSKVLDIDVYELLKPENKLPDDATAIIDKFTEDINSAIEKSLYNLRADYLRNLANR